MADQQPPTSIFQNFKAGSPRLLRILITKLDLQYVDAFTISTDDGFMGSARRRLDEFKCRRVQFISNSSCCFSRLVTPEDRVVMCPGLLHIIHEHHKARNGCYQAGGRQGFKMLFIVAYPAKSQFHRPGLVFAPDRGIK